MHAFSKSKLLTTEAATEFTSLRTELENLIGPTDVIERAFVDDLAELIWEILRLRRFKIGIIRKQVEQEAVMTATEYFRDAKVKEKFLKILHRLGLGEDAIEAEAFRLAGVDLERLDKMLSAAERRRYKLLRFIARYRKSLPTDIRQATERMIAELGVHGPEPFDRWRLWRVKRKSKLIAVTPATVVVHARLTESASKPQLRSSELKAVRRVLPNWLGLFDMKIVQFRDEMQLFARS